ncbi:hypothetical protein B4U80_04419, partial [Leptotrombidium deliense]
MVQFVDQFFDGFRNDDLTILWLSWFPYIVLTNGKAVEAVLSSNAILHKSKEYDYLKPWINRGLLTSEPEKWKKRRKLLSPAFNKNLLRDSLTVVNRHSFSLLSSINDETENEIDLFKRIPLITFDIICESIIGQCIDDSKMDYINAILFITDSTFRRLFTIPFWFDFIFYKTQFGKQYKQSIEFVHSLSRKIVKKRIEELENQMKLKNIESKYLLIKEKGRIFLDILIEQYIKDNCKSNFSIRDICEEVDTFIFEGFETTAATICWTLH